MSSHSDGNYNNLLYICWHVNDSSEADTVLMLEADREYLSWQTHTCLWSFCHDYTCLSINSLYEVQSVSSRTKESTQRETTLNVMWALQELLSVEQEHQSISKLSNLQKFNCDCLLKVCWVTLCLKRSESDMNMRESWWMLMIVVIRCHQVNNVTFKAKFCLFWQLDINQDNIDDVINMSDRSIKLVFSCQVHRFI